MDELDDLINDIIDQRPQEKKKPEAFSVDKPEPPKEKTTEPKENKDDYQLLKWTKVPARKRNPYCGFCKKRLLGGESHWMLQCEKLRGEPDVYWWCRKCLEGILFPPT